MPDVSDGPDPNPTDTAEPEAAPERTIMDDLREAWGSFGNPDEDETGQPKQTEAVETSEVEDKPAEEAETLAPEADEAKEKEPEKSEETSETEQTVNFDGFSDPQKATWERLLKDGHVTAEEVERARTESLFQSAWTKKTTALARQREAFEKEMEERKADLDFLETVKRDDRLHAAWLKLQRGEIQSEDPDGDDLVDKKTAEQIAEERYKALRQQDAERTQAEQKAYDEKVEQMQSQLKETQQLLGVDNETMVRYLDEECARLPADVDPILRYADSYEDLQEKLELRHEAAKAKARAEVLEKKLSKTTSKAARTAKQSLPPAPRVSVNGALSPRQKTYEELGIEPDGSNVQGLGFFNTD